MKNKKALKITSITVAILIVIVCITKILAAAIVFDDEEEEWESTGWGMYVVTEDGEEIYSEEGYKSKDGTYTSVETITDKAASDGFYYDELDSDGSIFCMEQGQQLPSRHDENEIRVMGGGSSKGDQYHNGSIIPGLNPKSTSRLNAREIIALERQYGDTTKAIRGGYPYNYFAGGTYYSRSLRDETGHINPGTVTTFATKNDGNIKWSDGTDDVIERYETISWEDAYVLANSDPTANTESNPAQLAIWKLGKLNKGKTSVESSAGDKLYEEALLFGTYRQARDDQGGPKIDADKEYKYKFVMDESGTYLIAGPVTINYGDLELSSGNTELEVRKIEKFTVMGTLADGSEQDITEYVKFTDIDGNELETMNETVGDSDGEGAGQKFPLSEQEFYIKVDYTSPIYTQIRAINSLEVSFKELDVRAEGYKYSDIPVYYTEWIPNNIISQDCYEVHSKVGLQKITTHLKGACTSRPMYGFCGWHSDEYSECYYNGIMHMTNTNSSEGLLLKGTTAPDGNAQMLFFLHKAELYWRKYKLIVLFGPENTPDVPITPETPETPSHPTYIDIGGDVWVDAEETKEGTGTDGKYTEGSADYPRPNVLVKLFFENGTPVRVGINGVVVDRRNTKLVNGSNGNYELYTDENGHYEFYGLPMDQKYYVEFTYDGMMYTTTEFLAKSVKGENGEVLKYTVDQYKSDPNHKDHETNSKAEEQGNDRTIFNNRFAEITGDSKVNGTTTIGRATGINPLEYRTETFGNNTLQSRLRTTDNPEDVVKDHATGKAKTEYEMKVRTSDKQLIYPFEDSFTVWSVTNTNELEYLKHINLGLKRRPTADFRLAVDLKAGATTIKDKEKVVFYKPSAKMKDLTVDATSQTDEYIEQEISASDYNWRKEFNNIYGDASTGFKIVDDQLNVYVLYKIAVANQCELDNQKGVITGIVDYFDDRLEMVPDSEKAKVSKLFNVTGFAVPNGVTSWVEGDNTVVNWNLSSSSTPGYNAMETSNLNLTLENSGNTKAIYVILKVKNNGDVLYNGVEDNTGNKTGIQNIAEIKSYKILDENNMPAGLVDCDSAPYNATPGKKETYEDDTDSAPMFQLILNWEPRKISGNVWDDAVVADAIKNGEFGIKNVEVELIEYIYKDGKTTPVVRPGLKFTNNSVIVDRNENVRTDANGNYEFYVEGGNYAIRFTYGDTVMLNDPSTKQYNAQDYFAAQPYSALSDMEQYNQPHSRAFATTKDLEDYLKNANKLEIDLSNYDGTQSEWESERLHADTENNLSSARDNSTIRATVIKNAVDIKYQKADLLNKLNDGRTLSGEDIKNLSGDSADNPKYTYMEAMSDIVVVASNDLVKTDKVINLGLQERPEASMKLEKKVSKIVVKTNDGTELINTDDASKLSNLQKLEDIKRVFINMDAKSMEGATIDIDYTITVTNDSKKDDVLQNYVYVQEDEFIMDNLATELNNTYFNEPGGLNRNSPLPIKANVIYDYVNINLEYREADNMDNDNGARWKKIYDNNANETGTIPNDMISSDVRNKIDKGNRVVSKVMQTEDWVNKNLIASDEKRRSYEIPIHLGITLAEDTGGDNQEAFVYSNCAEMIEIYSGAGRRDYETISGNYVPYDTENKEPDSSLTGEAVITPPLGESRIYYVITIISATIVIAGIVLIKKKVLKK